MNPNKNRILVVDDEPNIRRTLSAVLRSRGYEVVSASDGNEAVKLARETPYDIAIMDVRMPGLDGIQALQELIALDKNSRVVLMSGHGEDDEKNQALKSGATAFLEKPVSVDSLLELLRQLLDEDSA